MGRALVVPAVLAVLAEVALLAEVAVLAEVDYYDRIHSHLVILYLIPLLLSEIFNTGPHPL